MPFFISFFDVWNEILAVGIRYGKYCGVGWSGCPGEKPCDDLDACCKIHDECVDKKGKYIALLLNLTRWILNFDGSYVQLYVILFSNKINFNLYLVFVEQFCNFISEFENVHYRFCLVFINVYVYSPYTYSLLCIYIVFLKGEHPYFNKVRMHIKIKKIHISMH